MNTKNKIVSLQNLKKIVARSRRRGLKIAFTNGCFDILHSGHVSYLEAAKKEGRLLIVGLNSDSSVRRIKGPHRPIVPQKHRASVMAALSCVDYIVFFNEDTPQKTIEALQPDLLIKGADWKGKYVAGQDVVRARGGKVEFIKYLAGFSTTNIIESIFQKCQKLDKK